MACKTYARGLIFITVYQENSFYIVMQEGEGDQVRPFSSAWCSGATQNNGNATPSIGPPFLYRKTLAKPLLPTARCESLAYLS